MKQNLFQTGAVMALAFLLVIVTAAQPARAAAEGKPLPSDFVCHTVGIGDDDGKVIAAFGAPRYERTVRIQGILVKECDFDGDFTIGFAASTGKVIDITIRNKNFELRRGIRYGATSAWIQDTYGRSKRRNIDGNMFYLYANPADRFQHLMLQVDSGDGHLMVMRITGLPVDEMQMQEMMKAKPDLFRDPEEKGTWFIPSEKEIDLSGMPESKPVRLGGLTE